MQATVVLVAMPNNDDHVTNTLLDLGLSRKRDFKVEHDRCIVSKSDAIRRLVERRELVVAAGVHVAMVPNTDGVASLALASLGEPGFFYIMLNQKGRPVGEAPMRFDSEVGKSFVARAPGRAGSEDGPVPGRTTRNDVDSNGRVGAPSRERERASAGLQVWCQQSAASIIWVSLNAELEGGFETTPHTIELLRIVGPLANARDRDSANLVLQDVAIARSLAMVAAEAADVEPIKYNARGLRRLARDINAILQENVYTLDESSGAGSDAVSTAPDGGTSEEGQMADRKKGASGTKKGNSKKGAKKGAAKSNTKAQEGGGRRKITEEIAQQAIDMRENGDTWAEVQEATGFTGAQLRPHMAKLQGVDEKIPNSPKGIAAARKRGVAWYTIAQATGLSVADAKEKAAEGGADVDGRVYVSNENGDGKSDKKSSSKKGGKKGKKGSPSSAE